MVSRIAIQSLAWVDHEPDEPAHDGHGCGDA
jgi:hypothetical protein